TELYAILMDIQLKGSKLSGTELTQLFRGELPGEARPTFASDLPLVTAPIIFVTAYGEAYTEEQFRAMGGDRVINKPVHFVKLTLALANARARDVLRTLGS